MAIKHPTATSGTSASLFSLLDMPAPTLQQPLAIFPWDKPFLEHAYPYIVEQCGPDLGQATIIMPHNRPRRYLLDIFQTQAATLGPTLLPRMLTLEEVRTSLFVHQLTYKHEAQEKQQAQGQQRSAPLIPRTAQNLDCVYLLYKAALSCAEEATSPSAYTQDYAAIFSQMDLATFLPWGLRLHSLFEEYMHQMLPVQNIHSMQGEVSTMAAALLEVLAQLHEKYLLLLQQEHWTTAGLQALRTAQAIQKAPHLHEAIPPLLRPDTAQNKHVFFLGFSTLTTAEDVLLHAFWQQGAHICLHSDPLLASQGNAAHDAVHWACQEHSAWLKRWKAEAVLIVPASEQKPLMHFVAGYDVHSQLLALQQELQKTPAPRAQATPAMPAEQAVSTVQNLQTSDTHASSQEHLDTHARTSPNRHLSTAVVLTSPSLLMPTLHHLPKQNFNVSMGYPLENSPVFSLIESLLRLQESSRTLADPIAEQAASLHTEQTAPQNTATHQPQNNASLRSYYWRQLLHCIHHPFVQMLPLQKSVADDTSFSDTSSDISANASLDSTPLGSTSLGTPPPAFTTALSNTTIRPTLQLLEKLLRQGHRFVLLEDIYQALQVEQESTGKALATDEEIYTLKKISACLIENFATVRTAYELAEALVSLCQTLLLCGKEFWESYPLDAESLFRLMQHVIPALKNSALAHEILPQAALFTLCRQYIAAERVPFEADPLQGLQVLGMLETRLLHFDKILIVDATDDALPGFSNQDPLLPEALRQALGLPGLHERERVMAHTLHRLLASAKEVHFYWQEGLQSSGLFDDKKIRSRFVDTFLWEEEQALGRIIEHDDGPLRTLSGQVSPVQKKAQYIENNTAIQKSIVKMLEQGISPTRLDAYLQCPYRFILESVYKLQALETVNEGDDAPGVGKLLHDVLHHAYKDWEGKTMPLSALTLEKLLHIFEYLLEDSDLHKKLPPQSLMLLRMAVPLRFERFLQAQKKDIGADEVYIQLLEKELESPIAGLNGEKFRVKGKLDRVDKRCHNKNSKDSSTSFMDKGLMVLDYKTGIIHPNAPDAWINMSLWENIGLWTPTAVNTHDVLMQVAESFTSMQLPSYIHICTHNFTEPVRDAAWVALQSHGEEVPLFGDMPGREDFIQHRITQLLTFVIQHMHSATEFLPRQSASCDFCVYGALCHR